MSDPWEDQYDTETAVEESGPWEEFSPVIRNAAPGSLTPDKLVPGVRKIGGEIAVGEPGDTHPDIIDREQIPAKDIDQRVFVGPWDEVYDREGAKQALGDTVTTEFEPNRVHSTDLIKATKEPAIVPPTFEAPLQITEQGPVYESTIQQQKYGGLAESDLTPWQRFRRTEAGRGLFGPTSEEQELGIVPGQQPGLVPIALSAPSPFTPGPETIAGRVLLSGFIGQFIEQAPQAWSSFKEAVDRGDWSEARKIAVQTGFGAAFTALAGKGLHEQLRSISPQPPPPVTGKVLKPPAERGVVTGLGVSEAPTIQNLMEWTPEQFAEWKSKSKTYGATQMREMASRVTPEELKQLEASRDALRKEIADTLSSVEGGSLEERMKAAQSVQLKNLKAQTLNEMVENAPKPEPAKKAEVVSEEPAPVVTAIEPELELATQAGLVRGMQGNPMAEEAIWSRLKARYGIDTGGSVSVVFKPEDAHAGLFIFDKNTGKPIGIELNRANIPTEGVLHSILEHEAAHWFDMENPGAAAKILIDTVTSKEWNQIDRQIIKLGYTMDSAATERTARGIQALANNWKNRSWFEKIVGNIQRFSTDFLGVKLSRKAAESSAVRAIAQSIEKAKAPAPRMAGEIGTIESAGGKPRVLNLDRLEAKSETPPSVAEKAMGAAAPEVPSFAARYDRETLMQRPAWVEPGSMLDRVLGELREKNDPLIGKNIAPIWKTLTSEQRQDLSSRGWIVTDSRDPNAVILKLAQDVPPARRYYGAMAKRAIKGMGAAVPGEFPQTERVRAFRAFDGWTGRAKEALQKLKEYFTPPQVGALPEVEIQSGSILPRLPDYAKEKVIASAPQGMARVPGLGALMDTRAVANSPADAAFLARANSVSKGKTFAALWAQTQWRNKNLFHVEQNTGSFRLANGERGYLSDVIEAELRDPGSQPITHAQWQWIHNEWNPILDEIRRQLHNEGVSRIATEDMDFDVSTDYFPRPAIGKRNRPATGAGGRPAGRPGAKQFFQKSRKYASEEEGARPGTPESPKEEIIYDPDPVSRVTKFISGAYRAIADHRLANDPALGAGAVPDYWGVGRQTMAGPAFAGKIYPVEVAQKIERQFAQDIRGWVRATGNVTSAAKALMATADLSGPFIQGAAMFGRNPIRWAKATVNSYRALTDPNALAKLMEHPRYKELAEGYSQSGGSLLQLQDFLAGLQEGQIATRIPGYGRILTATGRAYGAFLDLAKLELFDAWRRVTPPRDMPRLVETIENSLFMGRMEQAGMNPHRAIGERLLLFAPSYYRGAGGLLATAFQKSVSGKVARQMLGGYAASAMLVSMSAYLALGMDWDEIKERLTPARGKFLKIPISLGDGERIEVGIGNILTQLVRLAGQAVNYHTSDKPIDTGVEANPYLRFLRGRSAFLPGVSIELATGRDYFGNRISAKESIARHFAPFVFQSMFPRDEAGFRQRAGDAAFTFFGLNAYPESDYEKARNQMDQMARSIGGKPFSQLNVAQRARVVYQFKKSPDYKKREPSPTDMERIIHLNAERQANLQKDLGDSAETLARVGLKVPGYKGTFRYKGVDVPMTESERERYQEILASMYQSRISRMNESALLRRPLVDREKWWSDEAEKIGVEARKRLMQEISKNTR